MLLLFVVCNKERELIPEYRILRRGIEKAKTMMHTERAVDMCEIRYMVDIIQNISCGLAHNRDHSMTSVPNQDPKGDFYLWQCAPQQPHMTTTSGRPPRTCRVVTFTTIRAGRSAPLSLYSTRHSWNKQLTHTHPHTCGYVPDRMVCATVERHVDNNLRAKRCDGLP